MAKYAVPYEEVYHKTFIIEADLPEDAEEKMWNVAANVAIPMWNNFDHWGIGQARLATKEDLERFDSLPEE